jgi:exopolyphosphatase / guanosine-5'-triphosphate,3'-diphosphate pyrophosphatase
VTRVAVVDLGTNSTRLLVADVAGGRVEELERRSIVTRLGEGLEASGRLGDAPMDRVRDVLEQYAEAMAAHDVEVRTGIATSAARDAANGAAFLDELRERFGVDLEVISGDEEAQLTYAGATAARDDDGRTLLVVDIGGGSTELVAGRGGEVGFHVSTQVGVVRHSERHLDHDPPRDDELAALAEDARATLRDALPADVVEAAEGVVAVAGTATMSAAMDLELEPYDADAVEGHVLSRETLQALLDELAAVPLEQRQRRTGLDPERAPTIVAGLAILLEVLTVTGVAEVEVSDRDVLWGRALQQTR